MQALVIFDSKFGNTERLARVIGDALNTKYTTRVMEAGKASLLDADATDLLVIGGPTQAHGMSPAMRDLLTGLDGGGLEGLAAATFDTRFRMPRWLTGSAARVIARRLRRAGCRLVTAPESFFVARAAGNPLLPGEIERAKDWATELAATGQQAGPITMRQA